MVTGVKRSLAVEFVLLSMFQAIEESIAIGSCKCHPRFGSRTESRYHINISIVPGQSNERIEVRPQPVGRCQIDGMISFPTVECSAIDLDAFQNLWNKYVRGGIAVSARIARQIVRHEVAANCYVLRYGLTVISSHARCKVLWRLEPARSGFDGVAGNRYRGAGPSGIRVQQVFSDKNLLCRIGREHISAVYVGCNGDGFHAGGNLGHLDCNFGISARVLVLNHDDDLSKSLSVNPDVEPVRGRRRDFESAIRPRNCLSQSLTFCTGIMMDELNRRSE